MLSKIIPGYSRGKYWNEELVQGVPKKAKLRKRLKDLQQIFVRSKSPIFFLSFNLGLAYLLGRI